MVTVHPTTVAMDDPDATIKLEKGASSPDTLNTTTDRQQGSILTKEDTTATFNTNGFDSDDTTGKSWRTLGRWRTALIFITNEVGIGILSLPAALQQLGLIPGVIAIFGLGILTTYTAYVLIQFYRRHPQIINIVDCGRIIGGFPLEIIIGVAFTLNLCLTCASAGLTMSIALNTITNHALCTILFTFFPILVCWMLCIPRTMAFVAHTGIPCTISILAAILIVMISLGISGPANSLPGMSREVHLWGSPTLTFQSGLTALLNIAFAYAGNQGFVTVMAEMRDPSRDFVPALWILQIFAITVYTVVAAVIYGIAGQFTTSPALGSAPTVPAKIAYGVLFPCLLGTGLVFGHTAIKYLYVVIMRHVLRTKSSLTAHNTRTWGVWIGTGTAFWIAAFLLANAIPVFSSILSVSSAIFVSWFTFGISGVFWLHMNWDLQWGHGWRKTSMAALNWAIILMTLFMNTAGLWASLDTLIGIFRDENIAVDAPFTCADNSLF